MNLFDLHCDTPTRMQKEALPITSERLDSGLSRLSRFKRSAAVFAIWSQKGKTGRENYDDFFLTLSNLEHQIGENRDSCILCKCHDDYQKKVPTRLILSVEGAELLEGDIGRLGVIFDSGVRVLTPVWKGVSEVGGGHDTDIGLTDFGRELICECERLGIIPDLSHMSEKGFFEASSILETPFIVSHSNSSRICSSTRNISDIAFRTVVEKGGLVGLNLYPPFLLSGWQSADRDTLVKSFVSHALHFLSLDGEKTLCIGSDRDGIDPIEGFTGADMSVMLAEALSSARVPDKIIKNIFFGNADRFFEKHFSRPDTCP